MSDYTRSMLRLFGFLGGGLVVLGTFVAWYSYEVVITTAPVAHVFVVPVDLWSLYPGAAALLVAGAVAIMLLVGVPALAARRAVGVAAGLLGLGITVYAAIRCFEIPDLGVGPIGGALEAETNLDGGPFLTLAGGALLVLGSLPVVLPRDDRSRTFAGDAGATPAAT
jgi:hypothetical protein